MSDYDVTKDVWVHSENVSFDLVKSILKAGGMDVSESDTQLLQVRVSTGGECLVATTG